MRKLISTIFTLAVILAAPTVWAQEEKRDIRSERRAMLEQTAEMKKEQQRSANVASTFGVGDPESFGKTVKFLGHAVTGAVYVYRSCDPAVLLAELDLTLVPEDRCVVHTGNSLTTATFDDLGGITLPARSADNLIHYVLSSTITNDYENLNGAIPLLTTFAYSPRLTIESAALNDPAAINPATGLPLNGVLTLGTNAGRFENRTIQPGGFESYINNVSNAAPRGLSRSFFADYGLPAAVINNLYRQPMTIKFGMRVSVRGVFFGQYFYSARLQGN